MTTRKAPLRRRLNIHPGEVVQVVVGPCAVTVEAVDPPCHAFGAWRTDVSRDLPAPASRGLTYTPPQAMAGDSGLRWEVWSTLDTVVVIRIER